MGYCEILTIRKNKIEWNVHMKPCITVKSQ